MSQNNGYATAEEFHKRNRLDVKLPSGLMVQIRKLRALEVIGYPEPGEGPAEVQARLRLAIKDRTAQEAWLNELICKSVVRPRIHLTMQADGELCIDDLHDDLYALQRAVEKFSLGAGGVAEASFHQEDGPASGGPGGAGVQGAAA